MHYNLKKPPQIDNLILNNVCLILLQGDSILQNKAEQIIDEIFSHGYILVDYEIKQVFFEEEKEAMYVKNLNNMNNCWWFSKEVFSLSSTVAMFVCDKDKGGNIFSDLKEMKGKSDPNLANSFSIRNKFDGMCICFNLIHVSDDKESSYQEGSLYLSKMRLNNDFIFADGLCNIDHLKKEIKLINDNNNILTKESIYIKDLYHVIQRLFRFMRDNFIYEIEVLNSLDKFSSYKDYENLILDICCIINQKVKNEGIFIEFYKCFQKISSRNLSDFSWEKFWLLNKIFEISIKDSEKYILIGCLSYNSL